MANPTLRAPYDGPGYLKGKYAVVTGGTQGVGEAIARLFAERGAAGLVVCGRNAANGARVAASISETGCPTYFVRADLSNVADGRAVIGEADRRFGRIDALVNAAGVTDRGNIFDTTEERYNEIFDVNVRPRLCPTPIHYRRRAATGHCHCHQRNAARPGSADLG